MHHDPHANEYLAAIAGLPEQTISPPRAVLRNGYVVDTYAVGDRIRFIEDGQELRGVVVEVLTDDRYRVRRYVPDVGTKHHAVHVEQIPPF